MSALDTLKGSLRVGVIISLGDRGENAAVPKLEKIAKGKNKQAAEAAFSSMAKIASDEAARVMLRMGRMVMNAESFRTDLGKRTRLQVAPQKCKRSVKSISLDEDLAWPL